MRNKEKITYEIDPHNRLIAGRTGKTSGVTGYRQIMDGRFKAGKDNSLSYHIKKSSDSGVPQQVKLSGRYSLDKDRNIVFTLNKWNNQVLGNRLVIKSELLGAKDDKLSFSVGTRDSSGNAKIYIIKLGGVWRTDKYNRLSFNVTRESGAEDGLTLQGAWQINDNNQIIYTYTKSSLKTKENITNTLTFKGWWDITEKHRISYVLNKQINSAFDFQIGLLKAAKKGLEYKISIGAAPQAKTLALSGKWKLSERWGLSFEMPCEGRKPRRIIFGATCRLSESDTLDFKLKNSLGEDLGISLRLSRKILKDQGEAFAQALREGDKLTLLAGIGFRW